MELLDFWRDSNSASSSPFLESYRCTSMREPKYSMRSWVFLKVHSLKNTSYVEHWAKFSQFYFHTPSRRWEQEYSKINLWGRAANKNTTEWGSWWCVRCVRREYVAFTREYQLIWCEEYHRKGYISIFMRCLRRYFSLRRPLLLNYFDYHWFLILVMKKYVLKAYDIIITSNDSLHPTLY